MEHTQKCAGFYSWHLVPWAKGISPLYRARSNPDHYRCIWPKNQNWNSFKNKVMIYYQWIFDLHILYIHLPNVQKYLGQKRLWSWVEKIPEVHSMHQVRYFKYFISNSFYWKLSIVLFPFANKEAILDIKSCPTPGSLRPSIHACSHSIHQIHPVQFQ